MQGDAGIPEIPPGIVREIGRDRQHDETQDERAQQNDAQFHPVLGAARGLGCQDEGTGREIGEKTDKPERDKRCHRAVERRGSDAQEYSEAGGEQEEYTEKRQAPRIVFDG